MGGIFSNPALPSINVSSWNIAAVNNNPFEYWMTIDENPKYNTFMDDVGNIMSKPNEEKKENVLVSEVFTQEMMQQLTTMMKSLKWEGVDETIKRYETDFANRKIITGFMHDKDIGSKRLCSMPDRITNTIDLADGNQVYRPTVINCYKGAFANADDWWKKWLHFMFQDEVAIKGKGGVAKQTIIASTLQPLKKAKYPAVSEEEEKISLPLQALSLAIFDAILIYVADLVAKNVWQDLRKTVCEALNMKKNDRLLEILSSPAYVSNDILFLQEVAGAFIHRAQSIPALRDTFHMISPAGAGNRDQNSVIFLKKELFEEKSIIEVTKDISAPKYLPDGSPVEVGDLLAIRVQDSTENKNQWLIASFHGDTNGLATIPIVRAVQGYRRDVMAKEERNLALVFGLDANTYEKGDKGKTQDVAEFGVDYVNLGLTSLWGDVPNPKNYTTFNARTFLQPQLNKAARKDQFLTKGDVNPKDFILFDPSNFEAKNIVKDNTGNGEYIENMVFPTLQFPSDHGIITCQLEAKL